MATGATHLHLARAACIDAERIRVKHHGIHRIAFRVQGALTDQEREQVLAAATEWVPAHIAWALEIAE